MTMMVGTMKMVLCFSFLVLPTIVQPAIMDDMREAGGSAAGQRRWLLRSLNEPGSADFAVELNGSNFDEVLKNAPSPWAIVEFFAHWCPACRNYKPQYEKVAMLFNGADAVHGGIIFMTRVDCALKCRQIQNSAIDFLSDISPCFFGVPQLNLHPATGNPKTTKVKYRPLMMHEQLIACLIGSISK